MKRQHFSPSASGVGQESCIALIDARFLAWLQGQADGAQDAMRFQLNNVLSGALAHNGLEVAVQRISVSYTHLTLPTIYSV